MAETATKEFKPEFVIDLKDDPKFSDLPHEQKLKAIVDLSNKDPHFMQMSGAGRREIIDKLLGGTPVTQEQPTASPPTGTGAQPLDPSQPEGSVQTVDTPSLYDKISTAREGRDTPALDVMGRAAVHTLDAPANLLNLATRGVGAIARAGGAPGIPSDEAISQVSSPAENLLTGGKGFPEQPPGTAIVQHFVDAAMGTAATAGVTGIMLPALQKGVPLTNQVINATMMALKGTTASEAAKLVGLPSWVQTGADLVASGVQLQDVKKLFGHFKNKYALQNHLKGISDKAGESFGGPSMVERQVTPLGEALPTEVAHTGALEQSLEDIKAPVAQATQTKVSAEATATQAGELLDNAQADTQLSALRASRATREKVSTGRAVQDQKDHLLRVTVANESLFNRALTEAEDTADLLAPEMVKAQGATSDVVQRVGQEAGEKAQRFYQNAYAFFKSNAEKVYTKLWQDHPEVEIPAKPLVARIKKYDEEMQGILRERFEPSGYMEELGNSLSTKARTQQTVKGGVMLDLQDVHSIRSSILEDLRSSPQGSPRNKPLKRLLGEINAFVEEVADDFPEAIEDMRFANNWYRTEVQRFTSGPGEMATKINPVTMEPVHLPEILGKKIFSEGPGTFKSTEGSMKSLKIFTTYMDDIDATLARAKANFDLPLIAETRGAREGLLDVARVKFYDAAMPNGSYDPKAAGLWLKKHETLINARQELKDLFGDAQAAHKTILDVQARGQGLLKDEQEFLHQFQRQETLASHAETSQKSGLDLARENQTAVRTTAEKAAKEAALAQAQEAQAIADYKTVFSGRNAASHALQETSASQVLGASPSDIVHQIESLSPGEQNYAYTKWFRKANNDPDVMEAILYEKWKNFLGVDDVANPEKASRFIKENKAFLQKFYPSYLKDIETVQKGFETAAKLGGERGLTLYWRRYGPEAAIVLAAQVLGVHHMGIITTLGGVSEAVRAGKRMQRIAALQNIYTDPASTKLLASVMRYGKDNPTWAASKLWSILVRSGAIGAEAPEREPVSPAPVPPQSPSPLAVQ